MSVVSQIKQFQTGSVNITTVTSTVLNVVPQTSSSKVPNKITDTISQLTSKTNDISSFLNQASINGGNQPFNLVKFAQEFVQKQTTSNEGQTSQVTDSKPITRKVNQITQKVVSSITNNYIKSNKLLSVLETNLNKILSQNKVNFISVENGQIIAQPIQNQEIETAIQNIQKIINTYVEAVDKYARRVYNTDPIKTTKDLQENLSLNHLIEFIEKVISITLLLLQIKIKIRKARDLVTAANAAAQVPVPNLSLATEYTERATQYTANEQKQLDDLASTQERILAIKNKISFYGKKYEQAKSKLLNLQGLVNNFQQQVSNKTLTSLNNQFTGSLTTVNNITGSK